MNANTYLDLKQEFDRQGVRLVAVSKTKPAADVQSLYDLGQRDFGENYVQELVEKQALLPTDIQWHFIGHLQSNKVKMIAPFVHLIHAVDSFKLLQEINKQAEKHNRVIDVLLQLHAAEEDTKFGMDETGIIECLEYYEAQRSSLQHIRICGLMGMATNTEDETQLNQEMQRIFAVFRNLQQSYFIGRPWFSICSMGMSSDYKIAIAAGSNMVRIGSMLFGERKKAE